MDKPTHRLVVEKSELIVSLDATCWHVLDHPHFFSQGVLLRKAFGMNFAAGFFRKPNDGVLAKMPAARFEMHCASVWPLLKRDQDLLSYSYTCEYVSSTGKKQDAERTGFTVRGLRPGLNRKPKGYYTLKLMEITPEGKGRVVQIIDLRTCGHIHTDDGGFLKLKRRAMKVAWYHEMPRILKFCEQNKTGNIEVRLLED